MRNLISNIACSISRLQYLTESQDQPFYLTIAPVAPHLQISGANGLPVPLTRHLDDYTDLTAPQDDSFNPDQNYTDQKPSWIKDLTSLTTTQITRINLHYRRRIQALLGIDEMVHDIVEFLDQNDQMNNTYSACSPIPADRQLTYYSHILVGQRISLGSAPCWCRKDAPVSCRQQRSLHRERAQCPSQ